MRKMSRPYVLLVTLMIATLVIPAAAGASAVHDQSGPSTTERIYGAMWVSPSLGDSYFASARDLSAAIERAGSDCTRAATDCAPGVWVKNGYASFAMDVSGAWGTGWGKYDWSAEAAAVAACEGSGGVACSVLQTQRSASYDPLGLTEGGIPPATGGWGGGGSGTVTVTAPPALSASATATATAKAQSRP